MKRFRRWLARRIYSVVPRLDDAIEAVRHLGDVVYGPEDEPAHRVSVEESFIRAYCHDAEFAPYSGVALGDWAWKDEPIRFGVEEKSE